MSEPLYQLAEQYLQAFNELSNLDLPEEAINDTLEGIQGEVTEKAQNVAAYILNLNLELESIKTVEAKMKDKRQALSKRIEWLKQYLKSNMERCGITEIKANDGSFTAKLSKGRPSVIIEDDSKFPDDSPYVKWERSVSKTAIKESLDKGELVDGARLEQSSTLRIS